MNSTYFPTRPILLVDDEEQFLFSASIALMSEGVNHVRKCQDSREVMSILSKGDFSVVVLDMLMPGLSGRDLLPLILGEFPELPVTVVTAENKVESAVESMRTGAYDFLLKPVNKTQLVATVRRGIEISELRRENRQLKTRLLSHTLERPEVFSDIVTQDRTMYSIFQYVEAIARTNLPVLITGETGVGKELIAAAIHKLSGRAGKFVPVNVAELDDHLFADTLFGHQKGAYTGADSSRKGLIEQASDGTLFLDEIGDLRMESQVKLLRLLQEGKYYPLGEDIPKASNARTVVSTNRDLQFLRDSESFRKDLYFRLQTHHIHLPPLRERAGDIPLLVSHFINKASKSLGKSIPAPPPELSSLLVKHRFPGNVRELEGMVLDAVSQHKGGALSIQSFQDKINYKSAVSSENGESAENVFADELSTLQQLPSLKASEQLMIDEALKRANGNQTIAAKLLGMSRQALHNRLARARSASNHL